MNPTDAYGADTLIAHLGEDEKLYGAVVPPLFQNSLFVFDTAEELLQSLGSAPADGPPYVYSRVNNPTLDLAQKKIAALEGTEGCVLTGSGMAAIADAVMGVVEAGSHAVLVDTAYGPAKILLTQYLSRFGVTCTIVDGRSTEAVLDAVRPETSLIYLESPTSLLFRLQDMPAITRHAREKGIATIADNTYATPLYLQPAALGVDLVVHSATKYLGGHSDLIAGAVCGSAERIASIRRHELSLFGNALSPHGAWLLTRGLRTLSLRLARHEETANTLATWMESRPEVEVVHHLSLASYPQRDLARQMLRGTTGLFSFEPKTQEREKVLAFCDALKLFGRGISWGGFESLVVPSLVQPIDYAEKRWVVRLFCGLEDAKDLLADVEQALVHLG